MIPNWLEKRHDTLWEAFRHSAFRFEDAVIVLKEKNQDSEDQVNVFLAELRKKGWLTVEFDLEDTRKRIYKLKSKDEIISELLSV
ncbi:MAG: SAM-dependent DNA methyltransferase, partial [Deltaproteobacteria bacterium]|nr:SAM-dependent DNA methyltransferase [Deltaproteobacteria bacterium]